MKDDQTCYNWKRKKKLEDNTHQMINSCWKKIARIKDKMIPKQMSFIIANCYKLTENLQKNEFRMKKKNLGIP
jgi:hypothetical protein